ncbi:hypothetical protein [Yersinia pseudotuberculosis]|uniref:hypothetical protein n=1 Tax=Yersinia pseudotuberculosis TaxID=633 RepID=UPI0005DC29F9|nr:hypothetical protein [Yersinia pseudotuberculosis]CNB85697.1 Uncharacterised protein [Yersinia pseudotuberculosis]
MDSETTALSFKEKGKHYTFRSPLPQGEFFEFRQHTPPHNAKPIVDDESGMCIGYSVIQAPGLWRIYDIDGILVRLEEAPLESPLLDPTDLVLIGLGVFRILRTGVTLLEAGTKTAASVKLSQSVTQLLRSRFKLGLSVHNLKMTETSARHMLNSGRYVPIQLMEKAIRYGTRAADPKKISGQFIYRTDIYKLVKRRVGNEIKYVYEKFRLHVVVREKDWTIMHFHYDR